jgi:hypothetical protein
MSTQTTEYVVLQATAERGLVREDLQAELDRHAANGYHIAHALAHYIIMERPAKSEERDDDRDRA